MEDKQAEAQPQVPAPKSKMGIWLTRTSSAFVAEYSIFLIAFAVTIGNIVWLLFILFHLIVVSSSVAVGYYASAMNILILWLGITSLISLPITAILWSRTQGEMAVNPELKAGLHGGAKGFRTFWIVLSSLGIISSLIATLYSPLAAMLNTAEAQELLN